MTRIPTTEITQFIHELALLLQTQISCADALKIVQKGQDNLALYQLIKMLQTDVEQGSSLADSLAKYPQHFEPFWVDLLRQTDSLPDQLLKIANYRHSIDTSFTQLNGKLKSAMSYFFTVFTLLVLITIAMLIYVIPTFDDFFASFGGDLPLPTRWLIAFSEVIITYQGLFWGASLLLLILWWQTRPHAIFYHLPLVGRLYHRLAWITILRTWALILSQHGSLTQMLSAAAQMVKIPRYVKLLQQLTTSVTPELPLSDALLQQRQWPPKIIHAVIIGTQTNQLPMLLESLAEIYLLEVEQLLDPTVKLFNLMITIFLGLLVACLVLAIYLPIFWIGGVI